MTGRNENWLHGSCACWNTGNTGTQKTQKFTEYTEGCRNYFPAAFIIELLKGRPPDIRRGRCRFSGITTQVQLKGYIVIISSSASSISGNLNSNPSSINFLGTTHLLFRISSVSVFMKNAPIFKRKAGDGR